MCDICQQTPCAHGCPNEPEPPILALCYECGEEIRLGDEYIHLVESDEDYCMNCATVKIAEVEEDDE